MPAVDPVVLELHADYRSYMANLSKAERLSTRSFAEIEQSGARMGTRLSRSAQFAGRALIAYLGTAITLGAARGMLELVDASKQIEAQLRLATRESGSFAQAQEDVRRIAMSTRSGLDETARLYSVFVRDSTALGISQLEAARATETLTKSFLISGASAAETSGATRQLIQGLQSGTLRGDEFNSVMEQAPRLQKLFSEALGVSKGELRSMAEEGKITAAALVDALTNRKYTESIDAEFRELPITFDQAMQQVENAATITFGAFDRGGQFSTALANFITDGTNGFAELEQSAVETGIDIRSSFEGLADVFQPLVEAARNAFGEIEGESQTLASEIRNLLGGFDRLNALGRNSLDDWIDRNIWGIEPGFSLEQRFAEGQARSEAELRATLARQAADRPHAPSALPSQGLGTAAGRARSRRGPSAESLAARAERERLQAIRQEGSKQQDVLRMQDDILAARAALATAAEDVANFEAQQLNNEQAARLSQLNTQLRLGELSEDEYKVRAAGIAEETALRRQLIESRRAEADAQAEFARRSDALRDDADTLRSEADMARTRRERAEIERSILDLAYRDEESAIRQAAANGQIASLDEALANLKRRRLADERMVARANMSPGEQYLDDLQFEADNLADSYENIAVRGLERMNRAFSDNIASALGLHGALGDIIGDFIELAFRQQLLRPLSEGLFGGGGLLGALFGGLGAPVNLLAGTPFGGGRATGGPVNSGTAYVVGELLVPRAPGFVVPNQQLQAAGQAGGTVRLVIEEAPGFAARVRAEATGVAIDVQRQAAPALIDASVAETVRRTSRPRM